ncbi:MAG: beta-propeller domain-containing protein, partial [Acetanaerobacterium sp.]
GGALYTDIMKLSFAAGGSVQVLRTRLAGELLGGMDERNGSLRLATKTQESDGADAAQISLHVLDGSLSVTGSAPWSQAPRSTGSMYYVGDTAYVGAADEGALLAAFDLSDPHEPRLVQPTGIQTLPDALVPLSDTLAAGISCTAGDTAGLRVSLYRTQGDSPKQLTSLLLGEDGSYCEATRTAGALLYDAKEGILGFPAMVTADSGAQSMQKEFGGYYVFRVSDESLTLAGRIEGDSFDPGDEIRRGVCVNGILYTASERTITSVDVGTLSLIDTLQWKS